MNMRLSSHNLIFHLPTQSAEKNGLIRSPINDDLPWANTWDTPAVDLFTRRVQHHDA